ncbi:MAG: FAD-binding protein, partial [Cyanobacteria bacterium J06659_2]
MTSTLVSPTQQNWQPIVKDFEAELGRDSVIQRQEELLVYECDGLTSYRQRPAVVVLPRSTAEVAAAVKICDRYQVPFVTRGAGT